ncbi:hypothetical protein ACH4PU_16795 [Streptomyces sp. NPDC021100]|uniref:hypothetical protein n=1 Tax=Streptomyces sp. NPDC021100 TaxID=3365114 RepID=UPI0037ADF08F
MSRRRNTLRITLASAAVAGVVLAPVSSAFASSHTPAAASAKPSASRAAKAHKDFPPVPAGKCVYKKSLSIGAGASADLYNTTGGPQVFLMTTDERGRPEVFGHLDRKHPSLPKDAGIIAKIVNAGSAQPKFVFQTQGGPGSHPETVLFRKLPKGCVAVHHVK